MSLGHRSVRSTLRELAGVGFLLLGSLNSHPLMAAADDVPVLQEGQDKVLFVPIVGEGRAVQEIREKEVQAIGRFIRGRGLSSDPVVTRATAPEVYLQVEPALAMALRDAACRAPEPASPAELLAQGRAAFEMGKLEAARRAVDHARELLPCSQKRLTRPQIAELLLWSGMLHPEPTGEAARAFLRGALATDPLLVEQSWLTPEIVDRLQRVAHELEHSLLAVDVHLPRGEGELWSHKNVMLDGRRIVFDKLFVQLTPGIHFLQIGLPDERTWGTFIELQPGTTPDLAEMARARFGLTDRYQSELERVLAEGFATPAFLQGLKLYTIRLKRDHVFLAAISEELGGTWITVRRYHVTRGLEAPELARASLDQETTASVPLRLFQPWAVDLTLNASNISSSDGSYRSPGGGAQLDGYLLIRRKLRVGLTGGLGARSYRLVDTDGRVTLRSDVDGMISASVGYALPFGRRMAIIPDVGYGIHLNALRGIQMPCEGVPEIDASGTSIYDCNLDFSGRENTLVFNLRARAGGPRVRLGLELPPFSRGQVTLRGTLRLGYGYLWSRLPGQVDVAVTSESQSGEVQTGTATLSLADDGRFFSAHQLELGLGINGTY